MYPFGHIDLRVRDIQSAYSFYSRLLPELGFKNEWRGERAFSFQADGKFPKLTWFGVIEDRDHTANASRLAFAVDSTDEVDRLAEIICSAGATNVEGPGNEPYMRIYYAIFFDDPSGNKLEIYFCEE